MIRNFVAWMRALHVLHVNESEGHLHSSPVWLPGAALVWLPYSVLVWLPGAVLVWLLGAVMAGLLGAAL